MADNIVETTEKCQSTGKCLEPILDKSGNATFANSQKNCSDSCQSALPPVEVTTKPLKGEIEKRDKRHHFFGHSGKDLPDTTPLKGIVEETNTKLEPLEARRDAFCDDVEKHLFKGELITVCGEVPNKYKSLLRLSEFLGSIESDEKRMRLYKLMMHQRPASRFDGPPPMWETRGAASLGSEWVLLYQFLPPAIKYKFEETARKHHLPVTPEK
jgi:hypothetical protein